MPILTSPQLFCYHICIKLTIVGSDNGLSTDRWQAITWANAQTLGTNFIEILSDTYTFLAKKMFFKTSSAKWQQFCIGLNVLNNFNIICGKGIDQI